RSSSQASWSSASWWFPSPRRSSGGSCGRRPASLVSGRSCSRSKISCVRRGHRRPGARPRRRHSLPSLRSDHRPGPVAELDRSPGPAMGIVESDSEGGPAMAQDLEQAPQQASQHDDMPLMGIDHVEYYVGNARQAAFYYSKAFGFHITAYSGPETKVRDRASYVLEQGEARIVLTGAMGPESPISQHVLAHGDGVKDVAFRVPDAAHAYDYATGHGATGVLEPEVAEDEHGKVVRAAIAAYGETIHSFIERDNYSGIYFPGYRAEQPLPDDGPT